MQNPTEAAAKVIYETWGGPWETTTEGRKAEARAEAEKVLRAVRYDLAERLIADLAAHDGLSEATYEMLAEWDK